MKLHVWNHGNEFRLQSEITGTLIVSALVMSFHGISQSHFWNNKRREISFEKLFKLFKNNAYKLYDALLLSLTELCNSFLLLFKKIFSTCVKDSRKSRPSSLSAVTDLDNSKDVVFLDENELLCFVVEN